MNVLLNRIDAPSMLAMQDHQEPECIYLADTVPAGSTKMAKVDISTYGHFWLTHITATYTTLDGAPAADNGLEYLRGQLQDGYTHRMLFNDYIPFSLWAVPGRRQSTAAGAASFQMHIIFPFEHFFNINGSILLDVKNDSATAANSYSVAFWGVRVFGN